MLEDTTSQTLPDGGDSSSDGGDTVGNVDQQVQDGDVIAGISKALGVQTPFKTLSEALGAIEKTKSFVGTVGQIRAVAEATAKRLNTDIPNVLKIMENLPVTDPQAVATPSSVPASDEGKRALELSQETARIVAEMSFFQTRPDLAPLRGDLVELQKLTGKTLNEVAEHPTVKTLLEKALKTDAADRSVSVLHSNPQIAAARSKMDDARESLKSGDIQGAEKNAVQAVIDAYNV